MVMKLSPRDMLVDLLHKVVAGFRHRLEDEILLSTEEAELDALIAKTEAFLKNEFGE